MNMRPEPMLTPWLTADASPVHEARVLTEGGSVAKILLDGQVYTLRITRQGKLILTK
jgi:hemin uptake protein HemP